MSLDVFNGWNLPTKYFLNLNLGGWGKLLKVGEIYSSTNLGNASDFHFCFFYIWLKREIIFRTISVAMTNTYQLRNISQSP